MLSCVLLCLLARLLAAASSWIFNMCLDICVWDTASFGRLLSTEEAGGAPHRATGALLASQACCRTHAYTACFHAFKTWQVTEYKICERVLASACVRACLLAFVRASVLLACLVFTRSTAFLLIAASAESYARRGKCIHNLAFHWEVGLASQLRGRSALLC